MLRLIYQLLDLCHLAEIPSRRHHILLSVQSLKNGLMLKETTLSGSCSRPCSFAHPKTTDISSIESFSIFSNNFAWTFLSILLLFLSRLYRLSLVRKEKLNAKYVLYVLLILEALDLRVRKLPLIIDNEHLTVSHFSTLIQ